MQDANQTDQEICARPELMIKDGIDAIFLHTYHHVPSVTVFDNVVQKE